MKRSILATAFVIAAISLPSPIASTWADDAHHPAQGTTAQMPATPPTAAITAVPSEATIRALQEALAKQGIAVKVDGLLNDETRAAIRKYQAQHHLPVTGEPDKATLDKLGVVSAQAAAPQQPGQGGMMMNCPMMQGGQMGQGGMMNCPMMSNQPGQTHGMGQGTGQGMMMHGMGSGQMGPGTTAPGAAKPGQEEPGHEQHHPEAK
jgi:hypothetical protein